MSKNILSDIKGFVNNASMQSGARTEYDNQFPTILNMLAKIFYKVGSAGKYISLIQSDKDTKLLISFPGIPPKMAIKETATEHLTQSVNNLLNTDPNVLKNLIWPNSIYLDSCIWRVTI